MARLAAVHLRRLCMVTQNLTFLIVIHLFVNPALRRRSSRDGPVVALMYDVPRVGTWRCMMATWGVAYYAFVSGLTTIMSGGRPIHDDRLQFEHLCLESLQCGLSWLRFLNKRDIIRGCFDHFDIDTVASYGESDIERILQTEGMPQVSP